MNPDYIFIFLIFLLILLFYIAIKYFKYLLFYLWVFVGFLVSVYWNIFLEKKDYNLWFLKVLFNNINNFFSHSKIVEFLVNNLWIVFFIFIVLLFHRFFYYLVLILLYFLKWFSISLINWINSKKSIKIIQKQEEEKNEA